ncbi:MAG: BatA and WFA domain-containing protein [Pirellulales bacterium]|nr:BatA and WFA domain-containing protein [Pirellulales bacterium]
MWPEWTSMLSWWQWTILALVPPAIVALYFLKLKRQPLVVPSTYLWHRAIEDLHVNSFWQRLRRSILLLLQLLLVALVILALFSPSWRGTQLVGDRFIFLIDNSASMSATDVAPSRLEEAKRQVLALVEQMKSTDVALVISFADTPHLVQPFTSNRQELRESVAAIRPTQQTTSLSGALRLAAGLANPGGGTDSEATDAPKPALAQVLIFSDGKFPDITDSALSGLATTFIPIGGRSAHNLAVSAFQVTRQEENAERLQAFARIENFGAERAQASIGLYLNGELIDADQIDLAADGEGGVEFNLEDLASADLELRIETADDLAADNRAWSPLDPPRRARVLCMTSGDQPLELALRTERARELAEVTVQPPSYLETAEYRSRAAGGEYDLMIYDRCAPREMPQANTWWIGRLPPAPGWSAAEKVDVPQLIDLERTHPLMQFVEMGEVLFREGAPLTAPPGAVSLIDSDRGPLLMIAPREAYQDVVTGFELMGGERIGTNWPLRPSFPVFVLNLLEYLGGRAEDAASLAVRPGQVVSLRVNTAGNQVEVVSPSGGRTKVRRNSRNTFDFAGTAEQGLYKVFAGEQLVRRFAVNLFDAAESDIRSRPDDAIRIGQTKVEGSTGPQPVRQSGWRFLLLAALAVLLVEWYIYNRRVYL